MVFYKKRGEWIMEIFDLFSVDRVPLNKTIERGTPVPEGCFRHVVHIAVFNKAGDKMLYQKRLATKKPWPDKWDISSGGSIIAGETSREGAHRELLEELGIDHDFQNERPLFTFNFPNGFNDIYAISMDVDPNSLKLQKTEVECVEWLTKEQIYEKIDNEESIPYLKSYIDFLFDLNKWHSIRPTKEDRLAKNK